ncbi:Gluconate 2-dehydrogenase subunit 3 [Nakamurella panacisegetis]|uniref:Gluconate 2-dehydrogenase subunit 3 n=1 Tax=Nakamurella panacisegetis TaxID=1090615 RepID=A0A1H0IYW1_9ACTN|nr:gluconate 2-dehydrogenase subunit 3 family protein [Nakamurella panacisegetis]SDO36654.1 Gluconate 2-dehydrogenase subunit 3 [Nakamurella panacisegetis]
MTYRSRDGRGLTPQGRGRFPGFDVLDQVDVWDDVTAGVVLARLAPPNDLAFFTVAERATAEPLLDLLLAQDREPRIPVLALIDTRLAIGETDGWHYDDLPQDDQAWRDTLLFLDRDAHTLHSNDFCRLERGEQAMLIQAVQDLALASARWHEYPAAQVWSLWTRYACTAFYSHPWAWNEIGFGGPAYPRGYLNPGINTREKWEVADHHDADPIPFVDRTERARRRHDELTAAGDDE